MSVKRIYTSVGDRNLAVAASRWYKFVVEWDRPIYSVICPSTFSAFPGDFWIRGAELPYELVIKPGYKVPRSLVCDDIDSLWVDIKIEKDLVVWDGVSPIGLFEVMSCCFDPAHEMIEFFEVRERASGRVIPDPRNVPCIDGRPVRDYVGHPDSMLRYRERNGHHGRTITRFYSEKGNGGVNNNEFVNLYFPDHHRHKGKAWETIVYHHPQANKIDLFTQFGKTDFPRGNNIKYGYALHHKRVMHDKDRCRADAEVADLIERGDETVETPFMIAYMKYIRNATLTPEDVAALSEGGSIETRTFRKMRLEWERKNTLKGKIFSLFRKREI